MNKNVVLLIVLTFLGMVGLYVLLYVAYQKYQAATERGTGSLVNALLTGLTSQNP